MKRVKRSLVFWVLLLASVTVPASATTVNKLLYHTNILKDGFGVGAATLVSRPEGKDYWVKTYGAPGGVVTKVALFASDESWKLVLCENGGGVGDCTYTPDGNLEIEGRILPFMFMQAGITDMPTFNNALKEGRLHIELNEGAVGSGGPFIRIM